MFRELKKDLKEDFINTKNYIIWLEIRKNILY